MQHPKSPTSANARFCGYYWARTSQDSRLSCLTDLTSCLVKNGLGRRKSMFVHSHPARRRNHLQFCMSKCSARLSIEVSRKNLDLDASADTDCRPRLERNLSRRKGRLGVLRLRGPQSSGQRIGLRSSLGILYEAYEARAMACASFLALAARSTLGHARPMPRPQHAGALRPQRAACADGAVGEQEPQLGVLRGMG